MNGTNEEFKGDILVVDDTPGNLQLLVSILRKNGYKVRPAINGTFAINAALTSPPDLILLDILMPGMDGYEVCQQLKSNPITKDIPIIFLTALSEELDKIKAFAAGGVDYITKPFKVEEVLARIANQMNQRSLFKKLQEQTVILHKQNQKLQSEISNGQLLGNKLLAAEQKMRGVFEAMTDIVFVLKIQDGQLGDIEVLPTNWVRLYNSETDLVSHTIELFFQPETASTWLSAFDQVLATRQKINFDYNLSINENKFCFAAAISPVSEDTVILVARDISERKLALEALENQKAKTEQLLLSILPPPIAHRLQSGESPISDRYDEVSVLFADLVGFTEFSAQTTATKLVELLNDIFSQFDRLAEKHGLEKIKTIGDAYMVVGGLPIPRPDASSSIALMALDMQTALTQFNAKYQQNFQLRIGIHLGPVVAGVIGRSKFIYDLWGDTVNLASRMESSGLPGKIQVTSAIYEQLNEQFEFQERGIISVKGKGEMLTYWLMGIGKGEAGIRNGKLQISNCQLPIY